MVRKSTLRPSVLSLKVVYDLFTNKEGITIKDLARNIKIDYKNVHDCIGMLFKCGIIKKEKIGNYNICKLNYSNEDIVEYLKEYNLYIKLRGFRKKYPLEYRIITETCEQLKREISPFFICLVFGSYAKGEEEKGSDIDILFLTSFPKAEIIIEKILNKINILYQKKFHLLEQNIKDFRKDLKNKNELSIATEIYKEQSIIFYGNDIFFKMVINYDNFK